MNTDRAIVSRLVDNDKKEIQEFFFVRCRPCLTHIGQYFCSTKETPEDLIGEFYEFLSNDDWHKLRIFKFTCSLNSYISIIASRYFQYKRDKRIQYISDEAVFHNRTMANEGNSFFDEDMVKVLEKMKPFDRFLIQKILIDGDKPGDILDEAMVYLSDKIESKLIPPNRTKEQLAGYIYTCYFRAKDKFKRELTMVGYGKI